MNYEVRLHKNVIRFLMKLRVDERRRCYYSLKELSIDPLRARPKCDIRQLAGKEEGYRLRVGSYRFFFTIEGDTVMVTGIIRKKRPYLFTALQ